MIALFSNNAELGALADACKEARFIRGIIFELKPSILPPNKPITIFEDNEGTISQANNNILSSATRTIALKFCFVREEIENKRIMLVSIPLQDQLADMLTKPLAKPNFVRLREIALGYQPVSSTLTAHKSVQLEYYPRAINAQQHEDKRAACQFSQDQLQIM